MSTHNISFLNIKKKIIINYPKLCHIKMSYKIMSYKNVSYKIMSYKNESCHIKMNHVI